jgi:hypothetical protein
MRTGHAHRVGGDILQPVNRDKGHRMNNIHSLGRDKDRQRSPCSNNTSIHGLKKRGQSPIGDKENRRGMSNRQSFTGNIPSKSAGKKTPPRDIAKEREEGIVKVRNMIERKIVVMELDVGRRLIEYLRKNRQMGEVQEKYSDELRMYCLTAKAMKGLKRCFEEKQKRLTLGRVFSRLVQRIVTPYIKLIQKEAIKEISLTPQPSRKKSIRLPSPIPSPKASQRKSIPNTPVSPLFSRKHTENIAVTYSPLVALDMKAVSPRAKTFHSSTFSNLPERQLTVHLSQQEEEECSRANLPQPQTHSPPSPLSQLSSLQCPQSINIFYHSGQIEDNPTEPKGISINTKETQPHPLLPSIQSQQADEDRDDGRLFTIQYRREYILKAQIFESFLQNYILSYEQTENNRSTLKRMKIQRILHRWIDIQNKGRERKDCYDLAPALEREYFDIVKDYRRIHLLPKMFNVLKGLRENKK